MDVIVIGAGVSGLVSAIELSRSGVNVVLLEEHEQVGIPSHCAGIVSSDYHEKLGIPLRSVLDLNSLYGVRFTNGSEELEFRIRNPIAKVISRKRLDLYLSEIAQGNGSRIFTTERAVALEQNSSTVTVTNERGKQFRADYAIVADGIAGRINRSVWRERKVSGVFPSAQSIARVKTDPSLATVFLSNEVAPDFFAYVVPLDEELARIGVASRKHDVLRSLESVSRKLGASLIGKPHLWGIPIGDPVGRTRAGRVLGVGDAVGRVKATSGGGIVFGGLSARLAASDLLSEAGKGTRKDENPFERRLLTQMQYMFLMRRVINGIGQDLFYETIAHGINTKKASGFLERADFDFHGSPSGIIKMIRLNPFWLSFCLRAGLRLFNASFK